MQVRLGMQRALRMTASITRAFRAPGATMIVRPSTFSRSIRQPERAFSKSTTRPLATTAVVRNNHPVNDVKFQLLSVRPERGLAKKQYEEIGRTIRRMVNEHVQSHTGTRELSGTQYRSRLAFWPENANDLSLGIVSMEVPTSVNLDDIQQRFGAEFPGTFLFWYQPVFGEDCF